MGKRVSVEMMVRVAILSAIAFVLMKLEFPLIAFYQLDLSGIPALLAGFSMGPLGGFLTVLIKDFLAALSTKTMVVGELADFIMLGTLVLFSAFIYQRNRTRRTALIGMIGGTLLMAVAGIILNYFVLIPFFASLFHMQVADIVAMVQKTVPAVDSALKLVLLVTGPFNIVKGVVLSVLTWVLYRYVGPILKKGRR